MEISKDLIAASSTPIVLAILAEADSYGYAILKRVAGVIGGQMEWTDGMLYPVLHRLERLGHVEARWEVAENRPPPQVLPDHRRRPRPAGEDRRQWQAVDATLRGIWRPLSAAAADRRPATGIRKRGPDPHDARRSKTPLEEQINQWRTFLRAGRRSTPSTWRSSRITCASRSRAWSLPGLAPTRRSWSRSSAWAASTRFRGSSRWSIRNASGSSSWWSPRTGDAGRTARRRDTFVAFGLAVAAAVAIKAPALFGICGWGPTRTGSTRATSRSSCCRC
jgi:PadR family transcriptional regulator PadR